MLNKNKLIGHEEQVKLPNFKKYIVEPKLFFKGISGLNRNENKGWVSGKGILIQFILASWGRFTIRCSVGADALHGVDADAAHLEGPITGENSDDHTGKSANLSFRMFPISPKYTSQEL